MYAKCHIALVATVFLLLSCCEGKYVKNKISSDGDFVFLTKFCFDTSGEGTLQYKFSSVPNNNGVLVYYDDEADSWPMVYKSSRSCADKVQLSKSLPPDPVNTALPSNRTFLDTQRPHFWYIAVAFCNSNAKGLEYELTMTNHEPSLWKRQFSFDEQGLEGLYMFWFLLFLLGTLVHGYSVTVFIRAQSYHSVVKLLSGAIVLEFLSIFSLFIHYVVYARDGVGAPGLKGIGDLLDIGAQLVFILLLILIAHGWCITKMHVDNRKIVFGGLGLLSVAYLIMFIWGNVGVDPATSLYIYSTAPGIVILVLRGLALLWFAYTIRATYFEENHPSKREFYVWFGIAYILWLITLPLIATIAAAVEPWVRQKTVMTLYVTANAVGFAGLAYLLWPSRATEYFQISSHLDMSGTIPYESI